MQAPPDPVVERRALALFERIAAHPGNMRFRERLLRRESEAVRARVEALETASLSNASLPTELPGWAGGALPDPPEKVGPFRLVERVGSGGMGEVWRAERADGLYDQQVAIKLIQPHLLGRAGAAFDAERRFLARMEHPNIARLIDGGVADGIPWLATEFIEGRPIDAAADGLSLRDRIGLFIKAADAVQFVHSRRIAHGDIKPANILVTADRRVKLLDFGIGSAIGSEAATAGAMTRAFASPERQAGDGPSVADDVFALGRTLMLVAGEAADADIAAIIAKATQADPDQRYGSAAALIADLDRWREQLPVTARPASGRYRAERFFARHRTGVLLTGLAMLLLMAATIVSTLSYLRAERERAEAAARFADARETARYLLFDLLDRMETVPGSLPLRADVARAGQTYLDRLSHARGAGPEVRLDAATGLWRLARYQALPGRPNLRQPAAARANLRTAARLARSVAGESATPLLSRIALDDALIAVTSDGDAPTAERLLAQAGAVRPAAERRDPSIATDYAVVLASLRSWQGRYPEVVAAARAGLALPPVADPKRAALDRIVLTDLLAEGLFYLERLDEAEAEYRREMRLAEAAHARWPEDNYLLGRLARARWSLGTTLTSRQRFAEASHILAQSAQEAARALAFDPADEEARRSLRTSENAYAQALAFAGEADAAIAILRTSATRDRAEWDKHPSEAARLRDYALSMAMLGEALGTVGRIREGCAIDADTAALFQRLRAAGRLTEFDIGANIETLEQRRAQNCR